MAREGLDSLKQAPETLEALNQVPNLPYKTREQIKNNETRFRNQPPGAAVVIANAYCDLRGEIESPQHDLNLMVRLLSSLDFEIVHRSIDRSDGKWKVVEMINDISLLKLEDNRCFLFYYSGHADVTGILTPDGHAIAYSDIIQKAVECESLANKPKIFIFDCSRAALNKEAVGKEKELSKNSLPSDCLVIFSTGCGGHAYGDRRSGSFFTQDLVKAVQHFCNSRQSHQELESVLEEVSKGVREYVPKRSEGRCRQVPVIISSLEQSFTLSHLGKWSDDKPTGTVMTDKVSVELVSITITPPEAGADSFDEQLRYTKANGSTVEGGGGETSQPGPETLAEMRIETETDHGSESGMELETQIGTELRCPKELNAATCKVDPPNVLPLPQSLDTCSLRGTETEEMTGERQKWCEVLIIIAIIVAVWGLMMFPVIFYHAVPTKGVNGPTSGEADCSSPEVYSGICQGFLQQQQTCLGVTGNGVSVPQGRGDETLAQLFINGLPNFLTLSPECDAVIRQFLCFYNFGLCDSSGELYLPSSGECRMVTEETCGPELEQAMMFIAGIPDIQLPQCDSLPANSLECTTGNISNIADTTPLSTPAVNRNDTVSSSAQVFMCSDGFYATELNGANVCKPQCGEWMQYREGVVIAIDVILITQAVVFLLSGAVVVILSIIQYKRMFKFPSVFIVYGTVTLGVYEVFHVIRIFDQKGLFCSSMDLNETVNNPTAFCSIQGSVLYYASLLQTVFWCCHVIMIFFSVQFPFRAKFFEKNGYFTYIHVIMVVVALILSSVPVIATFGTGGFVVSRFPTINCFASDVNVTFYALELPLSIILATGITLIVLIFYKVFGIIQKQVKEKRKGLMPVALRDRLHMNPAELKVLILFVYSVVFAVVGLIAFTVGAHDARVFVSELTAYFTCEATGIAVNKSRCEKNFSIWPTEILSDLTWVFLGLYPIVNLIYVVNIHDIKKTVSRWSPKVNFYTMTTKFNSELLS